MKISVVTPSYNQAQFLEETILSVTGQSYPNLEYLVIDGHSTDDSAAVIQEHAHHINYWVSEKDNGQSNAINKGFARATGDILCWLNSDDIHRPNTLQTVASFFLKVKEPTILFGNCIHFKEEETEFLSYGSDVLSYEKMFSLEQNDFIIQPSCFWNRAAWEVTGALNETMQYAFDWEWFLRAKRQGVRFVPTNRCLSLYRIHASHKSATGGKARQTEILNLYKEFAPHFAAPYELLMQEARTYNSTPDKIARLGLKLMRKPMSEGNMLRFTKPSKYKSYKAWDLDRLISML